MTTVSPGDAYQGCVVPPDVYEIGFGWDPRPEVERLLFLAASHGLEPETVLELGCGTGRLMRALRHRVNCVCGIDLNQGMIAGGWSAGDGVDMRSGDMSDFDLGRRFDLVHTSANTIRHVTTDVAIARMWRCIAAHIEPGGVFIADLEFGYEAEGAKLNRPVRWTISRGSETVCVRWTVVEPPAEPRRCCTVEFAFEARGETRGTWSERFSLRTYDASEFVEIARKEGGLELCGLYEIRDPYLFERPAERAEGRFLVVLRRPLGD